MLNLSDLDIHATIKKNYIEKYVRKHSTSKILFYHLTTRGRAGIKLGDADTSPSYLYFLIIPCYYIFCFGCLMGLFMHFYIIFGTNLLTRGPAQIVVFCLFQCFAEKEYQTKSKWNETFGNVIFGTNVIQSTWSGRQATDKEATRQGARLPPWARPPPSWTPRGSTDLLLPPIYTYIP